MGWREWKGAVEATLLYMKAIVSKDADTVTFVKIILKSSCFYLEKLLWIIEK